MQRGEYKALSTAALDTPLGSNTYQDTGTIINAIEHLYETIVYSPDRLSSCFALLQDLENIIKYHQT